MNKWEILLGSLVAQRHHFRRVPAEIARSSGIGCFRKSPRTAGEAPPSVRQPTSSVRPIRQRKSAESPNSRRRPVFGAPVSSLAICLLSLLLLGPLTSKALAATQCNTTVTWIPNNDAAGVDVPVNYPQIGDVSSNILDIDVSLDIAHGYVGDLDGTITSPAATGPIAVPLFDQPGFPPNNTRCSGDDIVVTFDDEAASGTDVEAVCGGGTPSISGTYLPQTPLAAYDAVQPNGTWTVHLTDNRNSPGFFDFGWSNQACVTVQHAAVTFDKWVSTDANCSDTLESLTVTPGTDVYYCYTATNPATEQLVLNPGDATDDQGLDLSGLEGVYAPGASTTVVLGPYVAGGAQLPPGTTTNTAQVTLTGDSPDFPATQTLVTSESATVQVSSVPPASGNKALYLTAGNALSRLAPSAPGTVSVDQGASGSWTLPALAAGLVIDGSSGQIPVTLDLDEYGGGSFRSFMVSLSSSDGSIGTFAAGSFNANLPTTPTPTTYNLNLTTPGDKNLPPGSTITLTIANTTAFGGGRGIDVLWPSSQATLPSKTVVNVDSVQFYDAALGKIVLGAAPGQPDIYVRAVISDPFGWADITSATVAMTGGLCTIGAATMTAVGSTASTRTFQSTATVTTSGATPSTCTASVTGNEGFEGTVSHNSSGDLLIGNPSLTILKSVTGDSKPGQTLTYSIVVANAGNGYTNSITLADILSPYTAFNLTALPPSSAPFTLFDGVPCGTASGLALGSPQYANDRPPTYGYVPVATGWDSAITAWRIQPLTGSMSPNSCFTLQYQAQVK